MNKRKQYKKFFINNKNKSIDLIPKIETQISYEEYKTNVLETKELFDQNKNEENNLKNQNQTSVLEENFINNFKDNDELTKTNVDEIDLFKLIDSNDIRKIDNDHLDQNELKEDKTNKKPKNELSQTKKKARKIWDSFLSRIPFLPKKNNFDFSDFEKNVEYQEFKNGEKLKIVAEIKDIHLSFKNPANPKVKNKVLRGPSIKFYEGKVHAIIGESGSGKSVLTSLLYGLTGSNALIDSGEIKIFNNNVEKFSFKDWENSNFLGKVISAVFQNPMSTLNPTMKVGTQITEGMLINGIAKNKKEAYKLAIDYLKMTKINSPEEVMKLYPHEMSGGMIQRVVIAAIVALKPKIIVMDEPTTALDPTVQALVLDVIRELQEKFKITIIFITHDLGVVASISDFISIMYAGQIIEEGTREEIIHNPQHPYTWGLILSMPDVNKGKRLYSIRGSIPSSLNNIVGEAFAPRNDYALGIDFIEEAPFANISETHRVKSWLLDSRAPEIKKPELIQQKHDLWKESKKHEA